jgi:hypothetical protein
MDPALQQFFAAQTQMLQNLTATVQNTSSTEPTSTSSTSAIAEE